MIGIALKQCQDQYAVQDGGHRRESTASHWLRVAGDRHRQGLSGRAFSQAGQPRGNPRAPRVVGDDMAPFFNLLALHPAAPLYASLHANTKVTFTNSIIILPPLFVYYSSQELVMSWGVVL